MATLMRWDPFGEMTKMQRDMDNILSRMGTDQGQSGGQTAWMPRINMKQQGNDLVLDAELAGIKPEDVNIEVTDGVLSISGERKQEQQQSEQGGWMVQESRYGSFQRAIALPEGVDPNSISADFHDGMLEIVVPKAMEFQKPQTTKIAIGGVTGGQQQQRQMTQGQQSGQSTQGQTTQQTQQTQGSQTQGQQGESWRQTTPGQKWQQAEGDTGRQQEYSGQSGQLGEWSSGQQTGQQSEWDRQRQSQQSGQAQVEQGWVTTQGQQGQQGQQSQQQSGQTERERERERERQSATGSRHGTH